MSFLSVSNFVYVQEPAASLTEALKIVRPFLKNAAELWRQYQVIWFIGVDDLKAPQSMAWAMRVEMREGSAAVEYWLPYQSAEYSLDLQVPLV